MLRVGMTGGIGSGKSAAAAVFARLGIPIIDTDEIARSLATPGQACLQEIVARLGKEFLLDNGELDRNGLRDLVFSNPDKRSLLESIMHPHILQQVQHSIAQLDTNYCIIVVPLLLETGWKAHVDRILVVDCSVETQKRRVLERDELQPQILAGILDAQASRDQRLSVADDIIYNDQDDPENLERQVAELNRFYCKLALDI